MFILILIEPLYIIECVLLNITFIWNVKFNFIILLSNIFTWIRWFCDRNIPEVWLIYHSKYIIFLITKKNITHFAIEDFKKIFFHDLNWMLLYFYRYDSDNPRVHGDVGMAGVAIDSVEDMKVSNNFWN